MIIAGNFKAYKGYLQTLQYAKDLQNSLNFDLKDKEIYIFPNSASLIQNDYEKITIGAQNAYPIASGAVTGEIGSDTLKEAHINTLLIGHSERRTLLKEDEAVLKTKFEFYKALNFKIFYCIGESASKRAEGIKSVFNFLSYQLNNIDLNYKNLVIAYEPIWAIGQSAAGISEIDEIFSYLKSDKKISTAIYGGSVNLENANSIAKLKNVDGLLIGGASLDHLQFSALIEAVK